MVVIYNMLHVILFPKHLCHLSSETLGESNKIGNYSNNVASKVI